MTLMLTLKNPGFHYQDNTSEKILVNWDNVATVTGDHSKTSIRMRSPIDGTQPHVFNVAESIEDIQQQVKSGLLLTLKGSNFYHSGSESNKILVNLDNVSTISGGMSQGKPRTLIRMDSFIDQHNGHTFGVEESIEQIQQKIRELQNGPVSTAPGGPKLKDSFQPS